MINKIGFNILIAVLVIELTSLLIARSEFFRLETQAFNLIYILFVSSYIILNKKMKTERSRDILANTFWTIFFLGCISLAAYIMILLSPLLNNPYTDPTFYLILMILLIILSLYSLIHIWIRYHKKYKENKDT